MDNRGFEILSCAYDYANVHNEEYTFYDYSNGKYSYVYIDKDRNQHKGVLISNENDWLIFSHGLAPIKKRGEWGFEYSDNHLNQQKTTNFKIID
ncbi:MAG: hypothetical protein ACKO5C_02940 [Ferruginibacter sp.]